MHFHYQVTFTGCIRCFCATTSHGLVTLTFDLLTLRVCHVQCCACPTHIPIFIILLPVIELRVLIWDSHCACAVSRDLQPGSKIVHIFEIPNLQFAYSLCHFQGATTKIKPCYRRKIAFSHYERYKVYCACAVSRDLCIGGLPKPNVTIFDPELPIHYTTFMGLRWRLRVVYIRASPCKSDFRSQKNTSKSVFKMTVFRKFKDLNMKYIYRDPQKAHP